jgi:hypothetical protein
MSHHRRKRSDETEQIAGRRRQRKEGRPHGWARETDLGTAPGKRLSRLRRPTGTPLLVFTVLGVLTFVGLARVHLRTQVLELGEEITEKTEEQARLLDRKRRLETERAFLRHPGRLRVHAQSELGMAPVPPERIQRIKLLEAEKQEKASGHSK